MKMNKAEENRVVAVIGSGLAGLTTAYLLRREGVEVYLIEKSRRIGFHSSSIEIDVPLASRSSLKQKQSDDGGITIPSADQSGKKPEKWTVDVPMRSFQGGYYPLLIALYKHLDLPLNPTTYTFSFSHLPSVSTTTINPDTKPYLIYSGASGRSIPSLPSVAWESPRNLVRCVSQFVVTGLCYLLLLVIAFLSHHSLILDESTTLRSLTTSTKRVLDHPIPFTDGILPSTQLGALFETFISDVVIPLFSAVGTMTSTDVMNTPARCILDYIHLTFGTDHYTLGKGTSAATVASRLSEVITAQGEGYMRLGAEIIGMEYSAREGAGGVIVIALKEGEEVIVDHVIIATQCRAAEGLLGMLEDSLMRSGEKEEIRRVRGMNDGLKGVEYRDTIVINHRDSSALPEKADRREINLYQPVLLDSTPSKSDLSDNATSCSTPSLISPSSSIPSTSGSSTPTDSSELKTVVKNVPYFQPAKDSIYTMATHIMEPPRHLRGQVEAVLQTTNPVFPIDSTSILGAAKLERALPLKSPSRTLNLLRPSPAESTKHIPLVHLVGSYAYPGIPLLEGCVGSARLAVGEILGRQVEVVGGVHWDAGRGGMIGRLWRRKWN